MISLDLSSFHTNNVYRAYNLFDGCSRLINIDISSFTDNIDYSRVFVNIRAAGTIKVNNEIVVQVIDNIPSAWVVVVN